jgi:glyoxylase-like metal-dependent hydrolase (beta-lactamase superfamily II)
MAERNSFAGVQLQVPTVGFTYRLHLRYGGYNIPLLAMPGPTAGNLWVHLPEQRIVFVGDSVLADQHPYISSPSTKDWLESLTILRRSFCGRLIIPDAAAGR